MKTTFYRLVFLSFVFLIGIHLLGCEVKQSSITYGKSVMVGCDIQKRDSISEVVWRNLSGNDSRFFEFVDTLIYLVSNNKLEAFKMNSNFSSEVKPLTTSQFKALLNAPDTSFFEDPDNPGMQMMGTIPYILNASDISGLKFIENWSFDFEELKMKKEVTDIILLAASKHFYLNNNFDKWSEPIVRIHLK